MNETETLQAIRKQLNETYTDPDPLIRMTAIWVWGAAPLEFRQELANAYQHERHNVLLRQAVVEVWIKTPEFFHDELGIASKDVDMEVRLLATYSAAL